MQAVPVAAIFLVMAGAAVSASAATPVDKAFVAKVSQGGMFEVQAGRLADDKGSTQDIRDFGAMEVHDHTLVGDRLKTVADQQGVELPSELNADFATKLAHLKSLDGAAFDTAYMAEMSSLHAADGAAFAKEAVDGGSADFRALGVETHRIVARHIGAIHAASPPPASK